MDALIDYEVLPAHKILQKSIKRLQLYDKTYFCMAQDKRMEIYETNSTKNFSIAIDLLHVAKESIPNVVTTKAELKMCQTNLL